MISSLGCWRSCCCGRGCGCCGLFHSHLNFCFSKCPRPPAAQEDVFLNLAPPSALVLGGGAGNCDPTLLVVVLAVENRLLSKSTMALLGRDISLCSLPFKVTFLLLGVDPLAELISAVHHAKQADTVSRLDSHTTRVDPGHQKTLAASHQQGQQQSCQAQHLSWQRSLVEVNQAIKA